MSWLPSAAAACSAAFELGLIRLILWLPHRAGEVLRKRRPLCGTCLAVTLVREAGVSEAGDGEDIARLGGGSLDHVRRVDVTSHEAHELILVQCVLLCGAMHSGAETAQSVADERAAGVRVVDP